MPVAPLFLPSVRGYQRRWLKKDIVAGLAVWAVLIPESLAYATLAGVPPSVGLYAAIPALVLYAILGTSRVLIVATMSATAALSASIVATVAAPDGSNFVALTSVLAIITGLLALVAGFARLGFLANFISEPVLKGFVIGLVLTIIAGQLPKLLGLEKTSGNFFQEIWGLIRELPSMSIVSMTVGLLSLAIVLGLRHWLPFMPGALLAVVFGIGAAQLLGLESMGVEVVGPISSGLPQLGLPTGMQVSDYLGLAGAAAAMLLLAFVEGLGPAKAFAVGGGYRIDANRELIALGAANLGSGLTSGMVVNGSLSKTAVNAGTGARSQLSGMTVAVLTIGTLLFLTGMFESLPEPTLAAIVIAAVIELVDIRALRRLYQTWSGHLGRIYGWAARVDFIAAIAALLGVLIFDTLPGLFIGIGVSVLLLVYRTSRPQVTTLVPDPAGTPGVWLDASRHSEVTPRADLLVLRVESGLFFANADNVRDAVSTRATADMVGIVLDLGTTPAIDVTATNMLAQLATDLSRRGIRLAIAHAIGQVRDVLRQAGAESEVLQEPFATIDEAVNSFALPSS